MTSCRKSTQHMSHYIWMSEEKKKYKIFYYVNNNEDKIKIIWIKLIYNLIRI